MILTMLAAAVAQPAAPPAIGAVPRPVVTMAANEPDAALVAKGRAIVVVILPPEQRERMFGSVIDSMVSAMLSSMAESEPSFRKVMEESPELRNVFERFIARQRTIVLAQIKDGTPSMIEAYARSYARQFTSAELDEILAFVTTPTGAKYMRRSADLIGDPDVRAWMADYMGKIRAGQPEEMRKLRNEIEPIVRKYEQDHPRGT